MLLTVVGLLVLGLLSASPAVAAPEDPFTSASASGEAPVPEGRTIVLGDWGVAGQRGVATYTFPISVPPGRNGMAPDLALRYSSGSSLRGGLAVGWRLDLPSITRDTSLGYEPQATYRAELRGASGRLIEVPDLTPLGGHAYRVEFDDSYTRFFRFSAAGLSSWMALSTDGTTRIFGDETSAGDHLHRWPITAEIDPFGNTVRYFWTRVASGPFVDYRIDRIEYSSNETAGLSAHAKVEFSYAPFDLCPSSNMPIGAAPVSSNPLGIEGSQRLLTVTTSVRDQPGSAWRPSQRVSLLYELRSSTLSLPTFASSTDTSGVCTQARLRYLTRVHVAAVNQSGEFATGPSMSFSYNARTNATLGPTPSPIPQRPLQVPGFGDYGTRVGAVGHLIDLDADGLLDRLSVRENDNVCILIWQRGTVGGGFDDTVYNSPLPTTAWHSPPLPAEGCSFNGQIAYRDVPIVGGVRAERGVVSFHFLDFTGDGRVDLLTNTWAVASHESYQPTEPDVTLPTITPVQDQVRSRTVRAGESLWDISRAELGDPSRYLEIASASRAIEQLDGRHLIDPDIVLPGWTVNIPVETQLSSASPGGPGGPDTAPMTPEGDPFLWRVYRNAGDPLSFDDGQSAFSSKPMVVSGPRFASSDCSAHPLPPSSGDSNVDEGVIPALSIPSLTDLDGDGYLDLVDAGKGLNVLSLGEPWCVFFGDGSSTFNGPYRWPVPEVQVLHGSAGYDDDVVDSGGAHHLKRTIGASLIDMNGDGRADLTLQASDGRLKAYLNTGKGFLTQPIDLGVSSPVEIIQTDYTYGGDTVTDGARGYRQRLVDIDGDGMPDLLSLPADDRDVTKVGTPRVRFNAGDHFLPSVRLPSVWQRAQRLVIFTGGVWHVGSDFLDVTGDGMDDLVRWSDSGQELTISRSPGLPAASDLLSTIENGRGGQVSFTYGLSTDAEVVGGQAGLVGNQYLPTPIAVVTQVSVDGGFGAPTMDTVYAYGRPQYRSSFEYTTAREHHRFLGFEDVQLEVLSEGDPVRRSAISYSYVRPTGAPDGRVQADSLFERSGDQWKLQEHKVFTWMWSPLFDGQLFVVNRVSALMRTCRVSDTPTDCKSKASEVRRTTESWDAIAPQGLSSVALYVRHFAGEGSGTTLGPLDRRTRFEYEVRYGQSPFDALDYRVLATDNVREAVRMGANGLQFEVIGRTQTTYDAHGLPVAVREWVGPTGQVLTKRVFDIDTGNLMAVTDPVHSADGGSGKQTSYSFDPHGLFVRTTTNELGHMTTTIYDVATGVLIAREGPNHLELPDGTNVPDRETWQIDGWGRVVAHAVSLDDVDDGYALHTVDKTSYFDSELPNRIRFRHRQALTPSVWTTTDTEFDGIGRRLADIEFVSPGHSAVTRYSYGGDGKVVSIDTPDPRVDDGSSVRREYEYDGLGRLVRVTLPNGSGIGVTYDGLSRTVQETSPDGSGGRRSEISDVFGRLTRVREYYPGSSGLTRFAYDGDDNLVLIVSADGNVTRLRHDWLKRRTSISRGGRVWHYRYDPNGNLLEETFPVRADLADDSVVYTYDDLDRVLSMTFPDPGSGAVVSHTSQTVNYFYDQGRNGVGRLSRVDLGFGEIQYEYDARGLAISEARAVELGGLANIDVTQRVERTYNAAGQLTKSEWEDGQQWRLGYDRRGLIERVAWLDPASGTWKTVASYHRSLAGAIRVRQTSYGQSRRYDLDELGRIEKDTIVTSAGGPPISTRSYTYTGAGDIAAVAGATDGLSATATFAYDAQHRLVEAEGPNGYAGSFTYTKGGNVRTANVTWNGSTQARDVHYEYDESNAEAVRRLENQATGSVYAQFNYDADGNMIKRVTPEGSIKLSWDGLSRLRRAETSDGLEIYLYDHTGNRMLAVSNKEVRFWFAERETHFSSAGLAERDLLHLSDGASAVATIEDDETVELLYADALENLMLALNSQGGVEAEFLYGAFGESVKSRGGEDHRRQFNGKEIDRSTGLHYYGFRYYDPLALRWNSADPLYGIAPDIGLDRPQRLNLYSFSLNNPVRYYDSDGHDGEDVSTASDEESTVDEEGATCDVEVEAPTCDVDESDNDESAADESTESASTDTAQGDESQTATAAPPPAAPKVPNAVIRALRNVLNKAMEGASVKLATKEGRTVIVTPKQIIEEALEVATEVKPPAQVAPKPKIRGGFGGVLNVLMGLIDDYGVYERGVESGRGFGGQRKHETQNTQNIFPLIPIPFPNPSYCPQCGPV